MPARNVVRNYTEDSYYHIYNRGVEKRIIFLDNQDYKMFLYYLFIYLAPPPIIETIYPNLKFALRQGNFWGEVSLLAYVLMPNHFHFLIHQKDSDSITHFMRRITNAYTR